MDPPLPETFAGAFGNEEMDPPTPLIVSEGLSWSSMVEVFFLA